MHGNPLGNYEPRFAGKRNQHVMDDDDDDGDDDGDENDDAGDGDDGASSSDGDDDGGASSGSADELAAALVGAGAGLVSLATLSLARNRLQRLGERGLGACCASLQSLDLRFIFLFLFWQEAEEDFGTTTALLKKAPPD